MTHTPKARYKGAMHRHTTPTSTKPLHMREDEPPGATGDQSSEGGETETMEQGLWDGASKKGMTTGTHHHPIPKIGYLPGVTRRRKAVVMELHEGYNVHERQSHRPIQDWASDVPQHTHPSDAT